jgi:hypothetical protein
MARTLYELRRRRKLLREQVAANLDLLIGSVTTKGPKRPGHNLTFKVGGVTRSRHIRKANLQRVRLMTARHQKLKRLVQKLSDLNWLILCRQSDESDESDPLDPWDQLE